MCTQGARGRLLGMTLRAGEEAAPDGVEKPASMFVSFMRKSLKLRLSALARQVLLVGFNVVLTVTNLMGIEIAGSASVFFSGVVLMPVVVLVLAALPNMTPLAWLSVPPKVMRLALLHISCLGFRALCLRYDRYGRTHCASSFACGWV